MNVFTYDSPVGPITISEFDGTICALDFGSQQRTSDDFIETPLHKEASKQLKEYFNGIRKAFDLPLDLQGTPFQLRVWKALQEIPYGETRSYKNIAVIIESPKAFRAIGHANNQNPIPIIVPCHRVIGINGDLVGYGGGLDIKKNLLEIEQKNF